jgi:hypothetical protein
MTRHPSTPRAGGAHRDQAPLLQSLRDWHILAAFALLTLVFFREVIFQKAFFWEDFMYQFYPFRNFATVSLSHGEIPLWVPTVFMGMPFLADITGTVAYLPHLILVPLVSGGKLNFWYVEMYQIAHVYLAGVSMYACAKSFGLSRIEAGFAGLVYMLSGFMTVHAIHLVMICQAAWFPFAVLLFRKALHERSAIAAVLAGVVMFLITCGGHIQITLYYFFFLFCYFLWEVAHGFSAWKADGLLKGVASRAGLAAAVVIIAVGLSAVQLLPTAELSEYSLREEMSYVRSTDGQLAWSQLLTLIVPKFFGTSNHLGGENPLAYWGPQTYWNFWETCSYIGIAALLLSVVAVKSFRTNRHILFLAGFIVFALLCALGDNFFLHSFFYHYVPGFSKFRVPGRWGFFLAFCGALLSGYGIRALLAGAPPVRGIRTAVLTFAGATALLTLCIFTGILDPLISSVVQSGAWRGGGPATEMTASARAIALQQTLIALLFTAVSAAIVLLLPRNLQRAALFLALLVVWQFADLYVFGFQQNNGRVNPAAYFDQQRPLIDHLVQEGQQEYFRVNARNPQGMLFDRNQGMIDRIYLTEGYTQLALKRRFPPAATPEAMYRLLNVKYRLLTDTVMQGGRGRFRFRLAQDTLFLPRAFLVYHAGFFPTEEAETAAMSRPGFDPGDLAALEEPLPEPLDTTLARGAGRATVTAYTNNTLSIAVHTPGRGFLVVSEMYFPGWNAYIDGAASRLYRTDWSLRGVVVEQGDHVVNLRYEPRSFTRGALLSGGTGAVCLAVLLIAARRRTRSLPLPHTTIVNG